MKNKSQKGKITCIYGISMVNEMQIAVKKARLLRAYLSTEDDVVRP